jgi:Undecaprenyl-phosphate glucose phosphotransferase
MHVNPHGGLAEGQCTPAEQIPLELFNPKIEASSARPAPLETEFDDLDAGQDRTNYTFQYNPTARRLSSCAIALSYMFMDISAIAVCGIIPILAYLKGDYKVYTFHINAITVGLLAFLALSKVLGLYRTPTILEGRRAVLGLTAALLLTFFALLIAAAATKTTDAYSRVWFFTWIAASIALTVALRAGALSLVNARLSSGACQQSALVVTCGIGSLSTDVLASATHNRIRALGHIKADRLEHVPDLGRFIQKFNPEIVIFDVPWADIEVASARLALLSRYAVEVLLLPRVGGALHPIIDCQQFGTHVFLRTSRAPIRDWDRVYKRLEDLTIAVIALSVTSPLLLLVAAAIKLDSKGPVLFKQRRAGFNGSLIEVWKFRSMYVDATDPDASHQTSKDDMRVTRVGRFIRRNSLDEFPQLYNVIRGEMSIVGPRPHALKTSVDGKPLDTIVEEYAFRHRVKPGITGWAQVNDARGEMVSVDQVKKRVTYDLYYINNWSILLDIKIILITMFKLARGDGAY